MTGQADPTAGFPVIYQCNENKPMFHPLLLIINHLIFIKDNIEPIQIFKTKDPCCDTLMALFLFCASKYLNEKFYIVIGILFRNLRECLNEHGYDEVIEFLQNNQHEKKEDYEKRKQEGKVFTETENCEFISIAIEKFIREYLPENCPDFDTHVAMDCMFDFSSWLLKKQFSKVKVQYKDESASISSKIEALRNL